MKQRSYSPPNLASKAIRLEHFLNKVVFSLSCDPVQSWKVLRVVVFTYARFTDIAHGLDCCLLFPYMAPLIIFHLAIYFYVHQVRTWGISCCLNPELSTPFLYKPLDSCDCHPTFCLPCSLLFYCSHPSQSAVSVCDYSCHWSSESWLAPIHLLSDC